MQLPLLFSKILRKNYKRVINNKQQRGDKNCIITHCGKRDFLSTIIKLSRIECDIFVKGSNEATTFCPTCPGDRAHILSNNWTIADELFKRFNGVPRTMLDKQSGTKYNKSPQLKNLLTGWKLNEKDVILKCTNLAKIMHTCVLPRFFCLRYLINQILKYCAWNIAAVLY